MESGWQARLAILKAELAQLGLEFESDSKSDRTGPVAFLVNKRRLYNLMAKPWTTGVTLYVSNTLRKTGGPFATISIFDKGSIRLSSNFEGLLHD
jgi:hypothetical protein